VRLAIVVVGVVVVAAAVVVLVTRADDAPSAPTDEAVATAPLVPGEPNVVVVMTDDQTLGLLAEMPRTRALLVDEGTTFSHALATFPNCCPSRATYLTGRYAHNHGVRDNVAPHGGVRRFDATTALPVALQAAGYDTVHIGKYLNGWGATSDISPPPGWTRWFGLVDPTTYLYTGYTVSVDGVAQQHGTSDAEYQTDVLAAEAVRQIEQRAGGERPFFLSFTPLAPHAEGEEVAAGGGGGEHRFPVPVAPARHADAFADEPFPRTPAYDEADVSDKPEEIRARSRLSASSTDYLDRYQAAELGALAAVDEAVEQIVDALDRTGALDETVLVFTSDNGLFHGEHRVVTGKFLLYEPAVRVPLVVRGPGFARGRVVTTPVANVDLAPTIAGVSGAELLTEPDGTSLIDLVDDGAGADRAVLLENFRGGAPHTAGVRTRRWTYFAHATGEVELYDLEADPDQLENLAGAGEVAGVEAALAAALDRLRDCAGPACTVPVPPEAAA
jgi:N-acetylglucosamine-6-sulfatase